MYEIKPCPFCGSKYAYFSEKTASVICDDCGASGPEEGATEEERIEAWNARAERTCRLENIRGTYEGFSDFYVILSCGHRYLTMLPEPFPHCPECGAKVVSE